MGTTIRELFIELGVKADNRALSQFDVGLSNVRAGMQKVVSSALVAAAGVAALTAGAVAAARGVGELGREIKMYADFLDQPLDKTQALLFTFRQFGADGDDMVDALATISDRAEDAQSGMQSFIDDFAMIGIAVDDLRGKDPMQLFKLYADAIANTEDPTKRIGAAVRILGDDVGRKLGPLLIKGRGELKRYMEMYEKLGVTMDKKAIKRADEFQQTLVELRFVGEGFRNMLGLAFIPLLNRVGEAFRDWFGANKMLIQQGLEKWSDKLENSLDGVLKKLQQVDDFVRDKTDGWTDVFERVGKALMLALGGRVWLGITQAVGGLVVALGALVSIVGGILAVPASVALATIIGVLVGVAATVLQVVAALGLLYLIWEDITVFFQGGDSLLGRLVDQFIDQDRVVKQLKDTFAQWVRVGTAMWELLKAIGRVIYVMVAPAFRAAWAALKPFVVLARELVSLLGEGFLQTLEASAFVMGKIADRLEGVTQGTNKTTAPFLPKAVPPPVVPQFGANGQVTNSVGDYNSTIVVNGVPLTDEMVPGLIEKMGVDQFNAELRRARAIMEFSPR